MRLRCISLWKLLACLSLLPLAAACYGNDGEEGVPEEIRAQSFVLTDSTGTEVRARLAVNDSGATTWELYDREGDLQIAATVSNHMSTLMLFGHADGTHIDLTARDASATVSVLTDEGRVVVRPRSGSDGTVFLPMERVELPPEVQIPDPPR